jgi:lipopolysaccharide export system permease protein
MTPRIVFLYLFGLHFRMSLALACFTAGLVWLGQFADAARFKGGDAWAAGLLKLTLLRTPSLLLDGLPFVILVATVLMVYGLIRRFEFQVLLMSGMSAFQVLLPIMTSGFLFGLLHLAVMDPLAAWSLDQSRLAPKRDGISVARPNDGAGSRAVIHGTWGDVAVFSRTVVSEDARIEGLSVFLMARDHKLVAWIDAETADLTQRPWRLHGVQLIPTSRISEALPAEFASLLRQDGADWLLDLPTEIITQRLRPRLQTPLLELGAAIRIATDAGLSSAGYQQQLSRLVALPALLAAISCLATAIALRPEKRRDWRGMTAQVFLAGFGLYTCLTVLDAMGLRQVMPPTWAAGLPVLLCLVIGFGMLRARRL